MILASVVIMMFLLAVVTLFVKIEGGGIMELQMDRYQNTTDCTIGQIIRLGTCDFQFTVQTSSMIMLSNGTLVPNVGTVVTKSFDNKADVNFTIGRDALGKNIVNPIDVSFAQMIINISVHVVDADIGGYYTEVSWLFFSIDLSDISDQVSGTKNISYSTGQLDITYKVICDTDYYGPGCRVKCVSCNNYTCHPVTGAKVCTLNRAPPDCTTCSKYYYGPTCTTYCNPRPDQYNCSTNGSKVCLGIWHGDQCNNNTCPVNYYGQNCTVKCAHVTGQYRCNSNGSKICQGNWNGTDCELCKTDYFGTNCTTKCVHVTGQYSCNSNGSKICTGHFTGKECDRCSGNHTGLSCKDCKKGCYGPGCDIICLSELGHYNCTRLGSKLCQGNWDGTDCDVCKTDYFGTNCTTKCVPVPDQYTCNQTTGAKICTTNFSGTNCSKCKVPYYGTNCNTSCVPVKGRYTCSIDGQRVCEEQWGGVLCDKCSKNYYGEGCQRRCFPGPDSGCDTDGVIIYATPSAVSHKTTGIQQALTIIATVGGVVVVLSICAACFGLVSVRQYNKRSTTPVMTEIIDQTTEKKKTCTEELDLESGGVFSSGVLSSGVLSSGVFSSGVLSSKHDIEQIDIYFRNPVYIEDM